MTVTANLGLPLIEAGQAQKHVTHNEALQRLDALIQIVVADRTRTAPPASPAEGERHVVAGGATGAWSGQDNAIAHFAAGGWDFIAPAAGWCVWSAADDVLLVFDGAAWRDLRSLPASLDNVAHVGINTSADPVNLLSVRSNAALFAAIAAASGGSGDVRLQLSKESAAKTASVVFSDAYSGRAEFGLVGGDAFKLKVSVDGTAWVEALSVDQSSGALALPRAVSLAGALAPAMLTADQNDYNPAGLAAAAALQLSSDAARNLSGLAGGTDGRLVVLINVGNYALTLLDNSPASVAANRFALGGAMTLGAKQAAILRYDVGATRWQAIAGGGLRAAGNLSDLPSVATAQGNLGVVAYANAQSLSAPQKAQARQNIALPPTVQTFLAGSGTYVTPANCAYLRIRLVGGGGGGQGSGTNPGSGGPGGATLFGSSLLSAGGGAGGNTSASTGGTASGGNVANRQGSSGTGLSVTIGQFAGTPGGCGPFGGAGGGGTPANPGGAGSANTGSGGGGGGSNNVGCNGASGAAGGYCEHLLVGPPASYPYQVGAGGAAGSAGGGGYPGGVGGSGTIVIEEYY